jgi:hypothetical protein
MEERLAQRLQELKSEFETGQRMLADLEAKRVELERTLLRISGAIQVLEEELGQRTPEPLSPNGHEVAPPSHS